MNKKFPNVVNEYHQYAKKNSSDDEDEDGVVPGLPLFSYYESQVTASVTHLYLSNAIGDPAAYTPLIQFLNTRSEGDEVHIHFNCVGGRLDTGIQILTAMLNSPAHFIGHLDNIAFSMAAILYLACESHTVSPFGRLMFHTYSGGVVGKAPDQRAAILSTDDTYNSMITELCTPFLTKKEIKDVLDHSRDLYFSASEIIDRFQSEIDKAAAKQKRKSKTEPAVELLQE